jgi:hypothetical protein
MEKKEKAQEKGKDRGKNPNLPKNSKTHQICT